MNLLHVVHGFPPDSSGGTELYVQAVCRELADRGHQCVVLAGSAEAASEPSLTTTHQDRLTVVRYRSPAWRPGYWANAYDPAAEELIRTLLLDKKPELVHVHHGLRLTANLVALCAERMIPAILTLHDQWVACPRINRLKPDEVFCESPYTPTLCLPCVDRDAWVDEAEVARELDLRHRQMRQELALAERLIVPSAAQRDLLHRITGVPVERFLVLPLGTLGLVPRRTGPPSRAPGAPLALAHWGALWPHKGVHLLMEALRQLPQGAAVEAHIFGVAPDPGYDRHLRELAEGLPVIFHGPYRPAELARHRLDVAVFPSMAPETYSFTLDEAFELGLAVVVSDRGALPERVGPAGLVFRSGDAQHLAHQLRRLLEEPELLERLGRAKPGGGVVAMDEHAGRLEQLYRQVMETAAPRREVPAASQLHLSLLVHRNAQVQDRDRHLADRDRRLDHATEEVADRDRQLGRASERLAERETALGQANREVLRAREDLDHALTLLGAQELRLQVLEPHVAFVDAHPVWRTYLAIRNGLIPAGSWREALYWAARRAWRTLTGQGPLALLARTREHLREQGLALPRLEASPGLDRRYAAWLRRHRASPADLERLREEGRSLPYRPRISVVTPVYDVEEAWLRKAIESVRAQVYENWELCLVNDASTASHIRPLLDGYAALDSRLRVVHLPANEGIVGASNHGVRAATGEFVGFLDHDDELYPEALFEVAQLLNHDAEIDVIYSDEDKIRLDERRVAPFFKPDWSPDLLMSMNYTCHFSVYRRSLLDRLGGLRTGFDGSQDYDLILRISEKTQRIAHIPKILYGWRMIPNSAAGTAHAKPYAFLSAQAAIRDALARRGTAGTVEMLAPSRYHVRYAVSGNPKVSVLIPVKGGVESVRRCVTSVESKSTYRNFEIVLLDEGSADAESTRSLETLAVRHRVLPYTGVPGRPAVKNFGAARAGGEYLLFLDPETEVVRGEWIEAMLGLAQRADVGAVGARLLYPSGRVRHGGMIVVGGDVFARRAFERLPGRAAGYFGFLEAIRNWSAVSGTCLMVRKRVLDELGGFDEELRGAFDDVDLCLRLRDRGYVIVYTPLATLTYHGTEARPAAAPVDDLRRVQARWKAIIERGDPYYHPNLSRVRDDFGLDV